MHLEAAIETPEGIHFCSCFHLIIHELFCSADSSLRIKPTKKEGTRRQLKIEGMAKEMLLYGV